MSENMQSSDHYLCPDLIKRIEDGLKKLGKTTDGVSIDDLAAVDEFHLRGPMATMQIIDILQPKPNSHLIDLGSGLGGPARRIAALTGSRVTGVDLSQDYCLAARKMSYWVNLDDKTKFLQGSVTQLVDHPDGNYDGAYSLHVGMNVKDRASFYGEAFRVLKNNSRFVLYDIVLDNEKTPVKYPQPWASKESDSHLVTEQQMIRELEKSGFIIESVFDDTLQAVEFLNAGVAKIKQNGGPPPLGLSTVLGPVVMDIFPALKDNFAKNRVKVINVSALKNVS